MVFLRFLAVLFIVLALMLLGADAVSSLEKSDVVIRSLTQVLALLDADPTRWLETTLPSGVAGIIETILSWPGWAILGVLGLAIGAMTRGGDGMSGEID
jgi:hypothetical protein